MEEVKTQVVNIKFEEYDIYIGRSHRWKALKKSIWHNPAKLEVDTDFARLEAQIAYCEHLKRKEELLEKIHELRGKRLGCWCAPCRCHGDVLAKLADSDDPRAELKKFVDNLYYLRDCALLDI